MSKLFFDHLLELKEIDKQIKKVATSGAEREELWGIVDEIVHHKVMGCILDKLPRDNHNEFLQIYHDSPNDTELIFEYLRLKVGEDVEEIVRKEIDKLSLEIAESIHQTR